MGWDGAGGYTRQHNFSADASAGIKILAARMDQEIDDFASAIQLAWARDGQNVPTADMPMGGRKFVNVGAPTSVSNFMRVREFIENVPIFMQDAESSADRISVSSQYFTSVSANQAPVDGTKIMVRVASNKSSAVLYLDGHSANVEYRDGNRIGAALVSGGIYEFTYSSVDTSWKVATPDDGRTAAEVTAGVTPTNYQRAADDPYYDVRRSGVVGDGVTDDTAALINAGKSSPSVFIHPSLTCRVTGSLATGIQSGQRWHGGGTIITDDGFNHHVFDISGKTDVTVEGLIGTAGTLGVSYSTATARFFRCTSSAHRCKLLFCKITGFQSAAQLNASEHCQVIGNDIITPDGWGVNVQTDAHDAIVAWNRINGVVSEHGIYVAGSSGDPVRAPHIHDNIITGCGGEGIKNTNADDSHIHDNVTYSNTGEGIYIGEGSTRAAVHDNTSYANAQNGILVFTSVNGATVDGTRVANNHVYENGKDGIRVQVNHAAATVSNTTIAFNEIDDNNQDASTFRGVAATITAGTLSGVTIFLNRIINETTGVVIGASVTGAIVEDNKFASNTTDITDAGTGTIVRQPGSIETLTGAGAVSLLTEITLIVTTGANALTLADGHEGQRKFLKMKTDAGAGTLTPANLAGGTTITFDDVGDTADLVFLDGEWCMVGGSATLA